MKKRIEKYLSSKEIGAYTKLDYIFKMYLDGTLKRILANYSNVKIFPTLNKKYKTMSINYTFQNITTTIDFEEDKYRYIIYPSGTDFEELNKMFIDSNYTDDFVLDNLIEKLDCEIRNHKNLKNIKIEEDKRKKYSLISTLSMLIPVILICIIALYVIIFGNEIKLNCWWLIVLVIIPLIIWIIFSIKSKK